MKYEMIREIYNGCENSKKRDVEIKEVEISDMEDFVSQYTTGKDVNVEKEISNSGGLVYHIDNDGLMQRLIFTSL